MKIAADAGVAVAAGHLGTMHAHGKGVEKDEVIARGYYETAAKLGDMESVLILAQWLATGRGGSVEMERAFELNKRAAKQGAPLAMYSLGVHYHHGQGVEVDLDLALHWYRLAAEKGVAPACLNAGNMYLLGVGVPVSLEKAAEYFKIGVDIDNAECLELYKQTLAKMPKK